jgi:tetratricopeptide (TPR) repeat protein
VGDILITTRRGLEGLGQVLIVPPMTQQEGTELLLRDHPTTEVEAHQESCSKIVERLGGLPLALDQAAAFIRYKQLRLNQLDEFLTLYDAQREQVLRHTPRFWKYGMIQVDGKEEENPAISALTTWEMSFQQLEEDEARRRDIEHFFTVSAFLQPDHIGESLFRHHWESSGPTPAWMRIFSHEDFNRNECHQSPNPEGVSNSDLEGHPVALSESGSSAAGCETPMSSQISWNAELFWDLISKPYDLSLLDSIADGASLDGSRFSLHPVICDWLQLRVGEESRHEFVCEAIEMVADSVRQMKGYVNHSLQARMILLGHVDTCVENNQRFSPNSRRPGQELMTCVVAGWFASFYRDQGRYGVAEGLYRQVYDTRRKTIGIEDASTLTSMNNLANALIDQGKYEEAEEMHRETLQLMRKVLGEEHPETLTSMNNLAYTLSHQRKYEEAEEMNRETLQLMRKVLGKEHPETLTSINNLAYTLSDQRKYEEAEEMNRETLQLMRKVLGEEYLETLTSMNNLGITLSDQRKYEEAEEMIRETLQLMRKVLGDEHPLTLTSMNNLALTLSGQRKYEEAEEIYRETLKLMRKVLGEEHPSTLTSIHNLAYLLALRSRFDEATIPYERAAAGFQRVLGTDHPTTRECVEAYSSMRNSRVDEN